MVRKSPTSLIDRINRSIPIVALVVSLISVGITWSNSDSGLQLSKLERRRSQCNHILDQAVQTSTLLGGLEQFARANNVSSLSDEKVTRLKSIVSGLRAESSHIWETVQKSLPGLPIHFHSATSEIITSMNSVVMTLDNILGIEAVPDAGETALLTQQLEDLDIKVIELSVMCSSESELMSEG